MRVQPLRDAWISDWLDIAMTWQIRIFFCATGLLFMAIPKLLSRAGRSVFMGATDHQLTFAWSTYGVGAVLILLAFLPPSEWAYKHITTKRPWKRNVKH